MIIKVLKNRLVGDIQQDFSQEFPYLRIEIFKKVQGGSGTSIRQKLNRTVRLSEAGKVREGELEISGAMTVGYLEKTLFDRFGISAQVSRKSGPVWLETTVTDRWTLQQQNEHGLELSLPVKTALPENEEDRDQ